MSGIDCWNIQSIPELVGNMRKINLFIGMVLTTVLLAACGQHNKPEFKGDISGENDLEQTQSYFTNGMHEVTKCPTGYFPPRSPPPAVSVFAPPSATAASSLFS